MKTTTFTLTCMALGIMAGVTGMHYHQVRSMVERGGIDARLDSDMPAVRIVEQKTSQPVAELVASDVTAQPVVARSQPVAESAFYPPRTEREDALLELLAEMRKEQKVMRKQMAETNREMAELTFRVDTHSDSFKPLRTDSQRPRSLDTSAPQIPISEDESVLPPKPAPPANR